MDGHRAERPSKRLRRLSTENESDFGGEDWMGNSSAPAVSTRPRRGTAAQAPTTIERSSPDDGRHSSIRLTVKSDPKKLKEATSGSKSNKNIAVNSRDTFAAGEIVSGPRQSRKKAIVEESSEEEEDEEEDLDAEGEEDVDMLDDEESELESDEDLDAEGEEEDIETPLPPLPFGKPQVTVTPAANLLSVEDKEMAMDDDDDELSSLDEDVEGEDDLGEEDAEGEDDDEDNSDEEISASATRGHTPDLNKLTRRQRAAFEELDGGLMALSNEAQKKKHLTAEEHAMRRSEMARRRKNLSEKRNEEEKMDTINRLLKKQAPKRRRRADIEADRIAEEGEDEGPKASAVYARYVQTVEGSKLAVPEEWINAPFGPFLSNHQPSGASIPYSGRMVEEVA